MTISRRTFLIVGAVTAASVALPPFISVQASTANAARPMQAAFIKHDGYQCGYCTPGQICSAVAVLGEIRDGIPSHASPSLTEPPKLIASEIQERMSGNICRCGAYSNIIEAICDAAEASA